MLGKKKQSKERRSNESHQQLLNMGLVPNNDDSDDDAALEAELQKLMYGGSKGTKPKKRKSEPVAPDLDKMVAACMADIPDDDDDASEDDADLLDELAEFEEDDDDDEQVVVEPPASTHPTSKPKPHFVAPIAPTRSEETCPPDQCAGQSLLSVIETRIEMYAAAEKKAKQSGETSRARRFSRGLTTLGDMRRKIKAGKAVDENDIPPALSSFPVTTPKQEEFLPVVEAEHERTPKNLTTPSEVLSSTVSTTEPANPIFNDLLKKRSEYKEFALASKKVGNKSDAMLGLSGVKQCDELMQRAKNGEIIDINILPSLKTAPSQPAPPPNIERSLSRETPIELPNNPEDIPLADPLVVAKTADEALKQRLSKYKQVREYM